jgi:hypothetical protein
LGVLMKAAEKPLRELQARLADEVHSETVRIQEAIDGSPQTGPLAGNADPLAVRRGSTGVHFGRRLRRSNHLIEIGAPHTSFASSTLLFVAVELALWP